MSKSASKAVPDIDRRADVTADSNEVVPGLEGVLAFESEIAFIDGHAPEFSVRGYDIHDIAGRVGYEEMCFLLWYDRLPSEAELPQFCRELADLREVPPSVLDVVRSAPPSAHPMATLRTAVSMLGMLDESAEDARPEARLDQAKSLTAKMATMVAAQGQTAGRPRAGGAGPVAGTLCQLLLYANRPGARGVGAGDVRRRPGPVRGA